MAEGIKAEIHCFYRYRNPSLILNKLIVMFAGLPKGSFLDKTN